MDSTWAIIERELRRFRRSPMLIVMSMIMPIVQLVVLGYAFGGNVKHLKLAVVDQDHGVPAVQRARAGVGASRPARAPSTSSTTPIQGEALDDLRNGRVNGVLTIPPDFSRRVLAQERAAGRADRGQHRQLRRRSRWPATMGGMLQAVQPAGARAARIAGARRRSTSSRSIRTCRTSSTCCRDRS